MSCIELILYLEPSSQFKDNVNAFLNSCKQKFGSTTANKYDCHITMTGFFNVVNKQEQENIMNIIQHSISDFQNCSSLPTVNLKSLVVHDKMTQEPVHLLLPVLVPDKYHVILSNIADQSQSFVSLRLKKINHISLAYWDEPNATKEQQQNWVEVVKNYHIFEQIKEFADTYFSQPNVQAPTSWDIVLYKRTFKSETIDQPHLFEELKRWTI